MKKTPSSDSDASWSSNKSNCSVEKSPPPPEAIRSSKAQVNKKVTFDSGFDDIIEDLDLDEDFFDDVEDTPVNKKKAETQPNYNPPLDEDDSFFDPNKQRTRGHTQQQVRDKNNSLGLNMLKSVSHHHVVKTLNGEVSGLNNANKIRYVFYNLCNLFRNFRVIFFTYSHHWDQMYNEEIQKLKDEIRVIN